MESLRNCQLVMYSPKRDAGPPTVEQMRATLQARNFKAERAQAIPRTTAWRRAVSAMESSKDDIRATFSKNGKYAQLDKVRTEDGKLVRHLVASFTIDKDGHARAEDVSGNTLNNFPGHVEAAEGQYTWADVGAIIQTILSTDGLGAYSPRKSGGVYFVPVVSLELLDRLEAALNAIGFNLLRYEVPDTQAQAHEVSNAIADNLLAACDEHEAAIAAYTHETKAGHVDNRKDAIADTRRLAEKLTPYLNGRAATILDRLAKLREQCDSKKATIQAYRPSPIGGRRIVTTAGGLY